MTMLNPARYQKVLQGMPDQALMQLLKRPDKIPSQFVIQEINRRKQMRQAQAARQQQVALASTMQQGMGDPAAAAGQNNLVSTDQPAMAKDGGHARYLHTGGHPHPHPHLKSSFGVATPINRPVPNPRHAQYEFDMTDVPQGPYGFTPLYDIESKRRALNIRNRPYILGGLSLNPLQTLGSMFPKYKPSETEKRTADTEEAYLAGQSMQGRQAGQGITNLIEPDDFTDIAMKGDNNELDSGEMTADDFTEASISGIKSESLEDSSEKAQKNINNQLPSKDEVANLPDSELNNQFKELFSDLDSKLNAVSEPYNKEMLLQGFKNSTYFDTVSEEFKTLNDKSQARVEAFNKRSDELRAAREQMIANLEKEGRTPQNIVFETLIKTGLNLMASPDASFMQALGKSGDVGLATFQNLRKEQKDNVRQKHLMSYQLAEQEFAHKSQADQLEAQLDLQRINFATQLQKMSREEKKDFIEESKVAKELEQKDEQLNIFKDDAALKMTKQKIDTIIALDKNELAKYLAKSLASQREIMGDAAIINANKSANILETLIKNRKEGDDPSDIINQYLDSKSNIKDVETPKQKLIREIGKEISKKVDLDRAIVDKEYAAQVTAGIEDLLSEFTDLSFGQGGEDSILATIQALKGSK